ncbi:hypothetical protein D9M71_475630 [compost metagenome]
MHVPAKGSGKLGVTPIVGLEGETEGEGFGLRAGQRGDARHEGALQCLVDEQVQAAPFQALVGHPGKRQVAQAVVAFVMGGAVVTHVGNVQQVGYGDAVVTFEGVPEKPFE